MAKFQNFHTVDILFIDVLGGFAPATVASPSGDISGKCSSYFTLAKVGYRNSTMPFQQSRLFNKIA
jgi:hypothetical protein